MAHAASSSSPVNNQDNETSNDTLAPLTVSDPVSEEVSLSPVHKRPKDDISKIVRPQHTDSASTDSTKRDSNSDSMGSDVDDEKSSATHALAKLVEVHSLKAVQFPVGVFVRIRPLVGKEVAEQHRSIKYGVKTLKKSKTQKLTIKKIVDDADGDGDGDENKDDDAVEMDEAQKKMLAMKRRLRQKGRDVDYKGFRRVLLPESDNGEVFEEAVAPFVSNVMVGQKTCIFSYGHTGSGKTHTIFGYRPDHQGMFELFAKKLLSELSDLKGVGIQVRFTELYNKKVYDLLSADKRRCYIREDEDGQFRLRADPIKGDDGKFRAYPVTGIVVRDIESLMKVIADGVGSRKCGESTLHDKSSRSHAFLEFEVVSKKLVEHRQQIVEYEAEYLHKKNEGGGIYTTRKEMKKMEEKLDRMRAKEQRMCSDRKRPYIGGVINFVDLAGNEYGRDVVGKEDGQQQRERTEINTSLMALKECIRALNGKKKFVGFRNSELTKYLKKYLMGKDAHAVMLAHIGPSRQYEKQSKNTLQYSELIANAAT